MVLNSEDDNIRVYAERLSDSGPMLLVYRDNDLLYPHNLYTYNMEQKRELDDHVWAQPKHELFLPISCCSELILQPGDVIVLAPLELQLMVKEIDIRGAFMFYEKESLPEIIEGILRGIHTKTGKPCSITVAMVV